MKVIKFLKAVTVLSFVSILLLCMIIIGNTESIMVDWIILVSVIVHTICYATLLIRSDFSWNALKDNIREEEKYKKLNAKLDNQLRNLKNYK